MFVTVKNIFLEIGLFRNQDIHKTENLKQRRRSKKERKMGKEKNQWI